MIAHIREANRTGLHKVYNRPTLTVRHRSGDVKTYEDCVEIQEGNTIHAFLPPKEGGFILSLVSSAGPDAIYEVADIMRRWYCADVTPEAPKPSKRK